MTSIDRCRKVDGPPATHFYDDTVPLRAPRRVFMFSGRFSRHLKASLFRGRWSTSSSAPSVAANIFPLYSPPTSHLPLAVPLTTASTYNFLDQKPRLQQPRPFTFVEGAITRDENDVDIVTQRRRLPRRGVILREEAQRHWSCHCSGQRQCYGGHGLPVHPLCRLKRRFMQLSHYDLTVS